MNPKYPIYVISKGRWESRLTAKALDKIDVPFKIVIEPQELDKYAEVIEREKILILPFSNLGKGSIPARNWVWDHAESAGTERHWILDDNIKCFRRFLHNQRIRVADGTIFKAAEDFIDRYENVALAGLNYTFLANTGLTGKIGKPFLLNTRIYSCILIKNDIPFRWRGRYNEDTDLSLRVLKAGWCTILFYAFLADKHATMIMKGGNTDELYKQDESVDGRFLMARSLQRQHPDVTQIKRKWGRWQHSVDYRSFKRNRLIKKKDIVIAEGVDNYGMVLSSDA
jgi:hypothetical protein